MTLTPLAVGQRHPLVPPGIPDGVRFLAGAAGLDLLATLDPLSDKDVRAWRRGRLRVGLVPAGRHTLFALYEVEGFGGWSDAPFSLGAVPPAERALPERQPHQGRLLNVTVVEARSAIVRGLRAVSLSPAFAASLDQLLDRQREALAGWTPAAHQAEIADAYRRWPRTADMVAAAVITEIAGTDAVFR